MDSRCLQVSAWSTAQNTTCDWQVLPKRIQENSITPSNICNINNNQHRSNDIKKTKCIVLERLSPCIYGLILGVLIMGLILAVIIVLWLTSPKKTMTTTTAPLTTTTMRPECSTYTTNTDPTRRITTGIGTTTDYGYFSPTTTWVRFDGSAGTQIVTSPPSVYECYTYYTGWYTGSMPTDGNTASGTVCYVTTTGTCSYSNTISVTDCGSFYVYGLINPPIVSYARYCTN